MTALYLDIETIPTQRQDVCDYLEEGLRDELTVALESVCAPANYKDEAKIAEFCANKRAQLQDEFRQKLQARIEATGVDGSFGQVFCIGWALDDEPARTVWELEERAVLRAFARELVIQPNQIHNTTTIGHNVANFDLRFLTQRFIVNGIRPPLSIVRAAQAKPWESEKVFDTMVQWAGVGGKVSLDKLCLALSIPSPKGDMDGSQVWPAVQEERYEEVAEYCRRDVDAVRAVHRRMTFQVPATVAEFEDVPA